MCVGVDPPNSPAPLFKGQLSSLLSLVWSLKLENSPGLVSIKQKAHSNSFLYISEETKTLLICLMENFFKK